MCKRAMLREERSVDTVVLATQLCCIGYNCSVRQAIGGGTSCFRNLRHEFIVCSNHVDGDTSAASCAPDNLIIDPCFRDHFIIPHPTPAYQAALAVLTDEFVGSSAALMALVEVLCAEMAASFEARKLPLPPWRRARALTSKWLPARSRDVRCAGDSDSGGGGGASPPPGPTKGTPRGATQQQLQEGEGTDTSGGGANSPGCSGGSPFERSADVSLPLTVLRQRSLLSNKLAVERSGSSSDFSGASPRPPSPGSAAATAPATPREAQQHGAAARGGWQRTPPAAGVQPAAPLLAFSGGVVCVQPPVCAGQPRMYTVRPAPAVPAAGAGAAAAAVARALGCGSAGSQAVAAAR